MNNNELQKQILENIKHFRESILKTDEVIRRLYKYKTEGKLTPSQIKNFEMTIEQKINYLMKLFKRNKVTSMNIELNNNFMELKMLWDSYKEGLPLKSRQEENEEAERLLDNLMGDYNREHYGKGNR